MTDNQFREEEFICDRCAQVFSKYEMIEEDNFLYCRDCYEKLIEHGEI